MKTSDGTTLLASYAYHALGRRVSAVFYDPDTATTRSLRYYYDGTSVIEERDGSQLPAEARLRYHVQGGQYVDEHIATFTDGGAFNRGASDAPSPSQGEGRGDGGAPAGSFVYYLHNDLYTVAAIADASGAVVESYSYGAYGLVSIVGAGEACNPFDADCNGTVELADRDSFVALLLGGAPCSACAGDGNGDGQVNGSDIAPFLDCLINRNCPTTGGPACTPGDFTGDSAVTTADIGPFVSVLLSGPGSADELCRADLGGPGTPGTPDGLADGHDIQAFVNCLLDAGSCPSGSSGGPSPLHTPYTLHGAPVDLLDRDANGTPRLMLQYNRARYYDLKHARWLQRDPTGYADGGNLYEGFGSNPGRNMDPSGEDDFDYFLDLYRRHTTNEGIRQTIDERTGVRPLDPMTRRLRERERFALESLGPPAAKALEAGRQVVARGTGALGTVGGASEATIGVLLIVPSWGTSTILVVHGADATWASARQTWTGEFTPTYTYTKIAESGHPTMALVVDLSLPFLSGLGGLGSVIEAPSTASRSLAGTVRLAEAESLLAAERAPFWGRLQNVHEGVMAFVLDAKPGEFVLGSGMSPGMMPGKQLVFQFAEMPTGSGSIALGKLDVLGRPSGVRAVLTPEMIGTGTRASESIIPPGYQPGRVFARGHLLAKQLGGSGTDPRNIVTLFQNPANSPAMSGLEAQIRAAVHGGQIVSFQATPVYMGSAPIPRGVTISAEGEQGFAVYVTILNNAGGG